MRYAVRRIAAGVLILFVVSILIFVGTEVLPGDTATAILGRYASPEAVAALREQLDLDRSAVTRYFDWLGGIVSGDLGQSAASSASGGTGISVSELITPRLINTGILAGLTLAILLPLGFIAGTAAALRQGRLLDHALSLPALAAISVPEFVTGAILIAIFSGWLGLLPAVAIIPSGSSLLATPSVLVLPVLTLLAASLAQVLRMVRAGLLTTLASDYVQFARLSGIAERVVVTRYGLRNAMAPITQVVALNIAWLIGGVVVVESLFAFPGIGHTLVQAVALRDIPVVQAVAMLIAIFYVALNIAADMAVLWLLPKLRTANR